MQAELVRLAHLGFDQLAVHVLAQHVLEEVAELTDARRLEQVVGQGVNAQLLPPLRREVVDVDHHRIRAGHGVLNPFETGGEHDREGQVGIAGRVGEAQLDAGGDLLAGLVRRDADRRRPVALRPGDVHRGFVSGHQAPVRVVGRVGNEGHLSRMRQHPGDEVLGHRAQVVRIAPVVEGVLASVEEGQVRVHAAPVLSRQRLRHEGRKGPAAACDLLDQVLVGLEVVRHAQRVPEANVDLVLRRSHFVVMVLDHDSHRLQRANRHLPDVISDVDRVDVEVSGVVEEFRPPLLLEVEVFRLGADVHRRAAVTGEATQGPLQNVAGIAIVRDPVRIADLGEHAHRPRPPRAEGQDLGRTGHRHRDHVALLNPLVALDRRAVEAHALLEGCLQLLGSDRERLEEAQDVGEPEANRTHVVLSHVV